MTSPFVPRAWLGENFITERCGRSQESPLTVSDAQSQRPPKGDETRSIPTQAPFFSLRLVPFHKAALTR